MRPSLCCSLTLALALAGGTTLWADTWDFTTNTDDAAGATLNELIHGTVQDHDFSGNGGDDQDWYIINSNGRSSYEVVVDSLGSDTPTVYLDRLTYDGTAVLNSKTAFGNIAYAMSVRWAEGAAAVNSRIRVDPQNTGNGTNDTYHIRSFETTIAVPRFNNAGGQVTVLIIQNPTVYTIAGTVYAWSVAGALLHSFNITTAAKAASVTNLTTQVPLQNQSGTLTITHDGQYGSLAVKSVALEPATGFSFDSPGLYRAN